MRLMVDIARLIEEKTGRRPSAGIRLESLSNFRIGGPADHYFEAAAADELRTVVELASGSGYRHYVIGGGFNLLFDDAGYRGLIIRVACRGFIFEPKSSRLIAQAGTPLSDLTGYCRDRGLGGLEFLAGIPGTVGGRFTATRGRSAARSAMSWRKPIFWIPAERNG
jgi:UDP-N-acetylmuramate dehydrogenase